jgi:MATE family multidrug resistance protein
MIKVNSDILVRSLCLQATFVILTSISARMGDLTLAVNAVLLNFQVFSAYALDGFANAAEAFTGEAIGAKDKNCFRASIRASSLFALVFSCGFTAIYWLAGPFLIDILTTIEEVRMTARIYLPWMVALPMISVWSFQLDGIFIGSTWTTEMRNGMLISLAVFIVSLYLIIPSMGNHGLWLAFSIFMVVRALTLGLIYPRLERDIDRLK